MFFLLYRWLPNRPVKKRSALAGALLAAGLWEVVKSAFAWILATTGGYQTLYGSLASVMATLIWTYFTCVIFFLGGAMAAVCEERHGAAAARGADASPAGDGELD
jgi:membrane protein